MQGGRGREVMQKKKKNAEGDRMNGREVVKQKKRRWNWERWKCRELETGRKHIECSLCHGTKTM